MNPQDNTVQKIHEAISRYSAGMIVMQANASVDGVAAATALYLALTKMGKSMSIVTSTVPQMDLAGVDKIQNTFTSGGNHLVISFPYTEGAIDKVDYSIAGESFNLIIVPNSETTRINPNDVKFSYQGGKVDFIIAIDVPNLNSLGAIYTENQNEFQGKTIVNIDRHLINNNFGTINYVNKTSSSTSELVLSILRTSSVELDKDIATNIYTGILAATNNFTSYSVNPNTFEAAAFLMKHGAVKKQVAQAPQQQRPQQNGFQQNFGFGQQPMPQQAPQHNPMPQQQPMPQRAPQMPQQQAPQQQKPSPFSFLNPQPQQQQAPQHNPMPQRAPQMPQQQAQQIPDEPQPITDDQDDQKNPQDWLKPKLFRNGNLM